VFKYCYVKILSHFSAVTLIGVPSDVYSFGAFYWFNCFSQLIAFILAVYVYYPVFFKTQLSTSYEYLEKRFDNKTRVLGSFLYVLCENVTLPVTIYGPALGLLPAPILQIYFFPVTGIKVSVIALVISCVCVFYTAIGGLRTIVWTDIFQFVIIIASSLVITWIGVKSTGGFAAVWNAASAGGRLDIFE
jgi:sodium-coupled monocarboxylate transporter 8/12